MSAWRAAVADQVAVPAPMPLAESQSCLVDNFKFVLRRGMAISISAQGGPEPDAGPEPPCDA
eukprot:8040795-Pyramimonas_sp.AAC.1